MSEIVIVGNGAAALSAIEALRARDRCSRVTVVSRESCRPYSRVLLPYFLRGRLESEGVFIRSRRYYHEMEVRPLLGVSAERLDVRSCRLVLSDGRRLPFDRLLLATGSSPVRPPVEGLEGPGVRHLWTLGDAEALDRVFRPGARVVVVGAGFVALQAAWAAVKRGLDVAVVELEERIMPRVLDDEGAELLRRRILSHGVQIHTSSCAESVDRGGDGCMEVCVTGIDPLAADAVVVAAGVRPNDGLLPEGRVPGRQGLTVADTMETAVRGVFAAGDVACGPTAFGGSPQIHALWTTAVEQGHVAGANMADVGRGGTAVDVAAGREVTGAAGGDAADAAADASPGRSHYRGSLTMNVTSMFGATVVSLGRFEAGDGDKVVVKRDLPQAEYLKLVVRDGIPEGAVAVGAPSCAALLGRLRPLVRQRRPLDDVDAFLEGRSSAELVSTRRGLVPTGVARGMTRRAKEIRCA